MEVIKLVGKMKRSKEEIRFLKPNRMEELRTNFYPILFSLSFFTLFFFILYSVASSYNWQFSRVFPHILSFTEDGLIFGVLAKSLIVTLELVGVSLILALFIGIVLASMSLSSSPVVIALAKAFVGIVRNTPLLMQLYLVYFVFAPIFSLSPFFSACLTLAFFEGAYMAEMFRAGFQSVPFTQWETGLSLGFSTGQVRNIIVLPQAVHNILPSLTGQIVSLIKDTSLVSAISVADLTLRASELISETYLSFEIWLIVALFYLILTSFVSIPLSMYAKYVQKIKGNHH